MGKCGTVSCHSSEECIHRTPGCPTCSSNGYCVKGSGPPPPPPPPPKRKCGVTCTASAQCEATCPDCRRGVCSKKPTPPPPGPPPPAPKKKCGVFCTSSTECESTCPLCKLGKCAKK